MIEIIETGRISIISIIGIRGETTNPTDFNYFDSWGVPNN